MQFSIDMKDHLQKDLYNAFFSAATEIGDDIFKMSCYAKHGVFAGVTKERFSQCKNQIG